MWCGIRASRMPNTTSPHCRTPKDQADDHLVPIVAGALAAPFVLLLVLILVSVLAGCTPAASPPATAPSAADQTAVRLYNTYGRALEAGAAVYTESLLAAGEAHARGVITDAQLAVVRDAGRKTETALRLAKAALQFYVAQQSGTAGGEQVSDLSARFAAFSEALTALTRVMVEMGVTR